MKFSFLMLIITLNGFSFVLNGDLQAQIVSPYNYNYDDSNSNLEESSLFKVSAAFYFKIWQKFLTRYDYDRCTFTPSCSEYSRQAIRKYGIFRGVLMTTDRLIRCHPRNLDSMESDNLNLIVDSKGREFDPIEIESETQSFDFSGSEIIVNLQPLEAETLSMANDLIQNQNQTNPPDLTERFIEDQLKSLYLARSLIAQKKYALAAYEYERFFLFYPNKHSFEVLYLLGLCRMLNGEWRSASEAFDSAIKSNEVSEALQKRAWLKRAESFYFNSDFISARQTWREYISRYPSSYEIGYLRILTAASYIQEGDWNSAAEEFDRIRADFSGTPLADWAQELSVDAKRWDNLPKRSGYIAGILGALIPGMGYAYCHRYSDGAYSFLINAAFGAATFASLKNRSSASGIFFGWLWSTFYLGNIYGGISSASKYNENQKTSHLRKTLSRVQEYIEGQRSKR